MTQPSTEPTNLMSSQREEDSLGELIADAQTTPSVPAATGEAASRAAGDIGQDALADEDADAAAVAPEAEQGRDEFEALVEDYMGRTETLQAGAVVDARIVEVHREYVLVDIGDKAEAIVNIAEFVDPKGEINVSVGETVPVLVGERDSETDMVQVSYQQARERLAWEKINKATGEGQPVQGRFTKVIKGGLEVDLGIMAFCPASHADIRRVENLESLIGQTADFAVLELNPRRGRVVVSRRAHLETQRATRRQEILRDLKEGDEIKVTVKSLCDFGVFCDLGGIDGLIPREELSWDRGARANECVVVGDEIRVLTLRIDREREKITLSRRRTKPDPWEDIQTKFPTGAIVSGKVVGLTSYGAFVHLCEGVTGLLHAGDLSWDKGAKNPADYLKEGDQVKVVVLDIKTEKRQLSLGLKQITMDPWIESAKQFAPGSRHQGTVVAVTKFGAFVRLAEGVEGLVHISDMTWDRGVKRPDEVIQVGAEVEVEVLKVDLDARRMSLSMKRLQENPFEVFTHMHPVGSIVEGTVVRLSDFGAFVELAPSIDGLIHVSQIAEERVERPDQVLKTGEKVKAVVVKIDSDSGKIGLSIRDYLKRQEKESLKEFMSGMRSQHGGHNMGELLRNAAISVDAGQSQDADKTA